MKNCLKCFEEETLLQTNVCKIGYLRDHIIINRTPKCHPDISREGIAYSWGCANNYYRQLSLDKKKDKKNSKKCPRGHTKRQPYHKAVLYVYRRAQEYIISYKLMSHRQTLAGLNIDLFTHIYVERIYNTVKNFKVHGCKLDFDSLFIRIIVKEEKIMK